MKYANPILFLAVTAVVPATLALPAWAQGAEGSYTIQGGASTFFPNTTNSFDVTQASPVTQAAFNSIGSTIGSIIAGPGTFGVAATADTGLLQVALQGTSTSANVQGAPRNGALMGGNATARARYTDFVISTTLPNATSVQGSVNGIFNYSGTITDVTTANISREGATARITVPGGTAFSVAESTQSEGFTSPTFTLPVGVPFTLGMELSVGIQSILAGRIPTGGGTPQAGLTESVSIDSALSLGSALSGGGGAPFANPNSLTGPVFNLPAGYTVNSVQANIVNNQWFGPTLVTVVPEAGTFALALPALGLVGAVVIRRHRK
ncbi:MAG: hypothetical protein H8F28_01530 [Fibrella sp.]|nr:hypothetical protein [Armatimonadota bacterium]